MKSHPINCIVNKTKPARIAKVALDDHHAPVLLLWCKKCHIEHKCSLGQLLQSWGEMMKGDKQALTFHQGQLKKALVDVQAALEDVKQREDEQQQEEAAG